MEAASIVNENPGTLLPSNTDYSSKDESTESGPIVDINKDSEQIFVSKEDVKVSELKSDGSGVTGEIILEHRDVTNGKDDKVEQCTTGGLKVNNSTLALEVVEQTASIGDNGIVQVASVDDTVMEHIEIEVGDSKDLKRSQGDDGETEEAEHKYVQSREVTDSVSEPVGADMSEASDKLQVAVDQAVKAGGVLDATLTEEGEAVLAEKDPVKIPALDLDVEEGGALVKPVGTIISSDLPTGVGQSPSGHVDHLAESSDRPMSMIDNVMSLGVECSSEDANPKEDSLSGARLSLQRTQSSLNNNLNKKLEELMVVDDSRREMNKFEISSGSLAEVVAAGIAAGVAEGIAESIAETIAKEAAGGGGHLAEASLLEGGRVGRIDIAKAVAEAIAEGVAQEVAQGWADGFAEAAAVVQGNSGVVERDVVKSQDGSQDGVCCDCGSIAVVRVIGEKSPNRGLRYLMCALQEPSFFKRKGKRKSSDTVGKCTFFRWLDPPRYTKEDKKKQEKEKLRQHEELRQQEELFASHSTRSSAKKGSSHLESPTPVGPLSVDGDEVHPLEAPSSTEDPASKEAPEFTSVRNRRHGSRQQRGRLLSESDEVNAIAAEDQLNTAGSFHNSESQEEEMVKELVDPHAVKERRQGRRSSSAKAIELDHKSRISTGGLAGDSTSSGAQVGQHISHHGTRSAPKMGRSTSVADQTPHGPSKRYADSIGTPEGAAAKTQGQALSDTPELKEVHFTRSSSKRGTSEIVEEQNVEIPPVNVPASVLGKRTSDWTDSYIGPALGLGKGGQVRKRRSVRGESGASNRYSLGGNASVANPGLYSGEKKPLHYIRRSTGQIGVPAERTSNKRSIPSLVLADVATALAGHKDEKDGRFRRSTTKVKFSSVEEKSRSLLGSAAEKLQLGGGTNKPRVSQPTEDSPTMETEKRKQSQTRRQQRKLPLSEVYGSVEPLPPIKPISKAVTSLVDKDQSPSPSRVSLGKSTSPVAIEQKDAVHSKSPLKKRKLSRVLSEDIGSPDTDISKRLAAKKGKSGVYMTSGRQNLCFSLVDTPLVASLFPTVRYAAKLPAEEYHDPDDPWSLDGPWAKKEDKEEEMQGQQEEEEDKRQMKEVRKVMEMEEEKGEEEEEMDTEKEKESTSQVVEAVEPLVVSDSHEHGVNTGPGLISRQVGGEVSELSDVNQEPTRDTGDALSEKDHGSEGFPNPSISQVPAAHAGLHEGEKELGHSEREGNPVKVPDQTDIVVGDCLPPVPNSETGEELPSSYDCRESTSIKGSDDLAVQIVGEVGHQPAVLSLFPVGSEVQDLQKNQEDTSGDQTKADCSGKKPEGCSELIVDTVPHPSGGGDSLSFQGEGEISKRREAEVTILDQGEGIAKGASILSANKVESSSGAASDAVSLPPVLDESRPLQEENKAEQCTEDVIIAGSDEVGGTAEDISLLTSPAAAKDFKLPVNYEAPANEDIHHVEKTHDMQVGLKTSMFVKDQEYPVAHDEQKSLPRAKDDLILAAAVKDSVKPDIYIDQNLSMSNNNDCNIIVGKASTLDKGFGDCVLLTDDVQYPKALLSDSQYEQVSTRGNDDLVVDVVTSSDHQEVPACNDVGNPAEPAGMLPARVELQLGAPVEERNSSALKEGSTVGRVKDTTCDPLESTSDLSIKAAESCDLLAAGICSQAEIVVHESRLSDCATTEEVAIGDGNNQCAVEKADRPSPVQLMPSNDDVEMIEGVKEPVHSRFMEVANIEDVVMADAIEEGASQEPNVLGVVVSESLLPELEHQLKISADLPPDEPDLPGAGSQATFKKNDELVPIEEKHEIGDFQGTVNENADLVDETADEPAISGNNVNVAPSPDAKVSEVSTSAHVVGTIIASPSSVQEDTGGATPQKLDSTRAPAASENAGFVDSVWRLASGRKTRSVGSIGAPAVTSKRSRTVISSHKAGRVRDYRGGHRHQAEAQWVDVPLHWRNEKSTGRINLLPNAPSTNLLDSSPIQSGLRPLQSTDDICGTHDSRPRLTAGEVDESSNITEEKGKVHDPSTRASTESHTIDPNGAANNEGASELGATNAAGSGQVPSLGSRPLNTGAVGSKGGDLDWALKPHSGEQTSNPVALGQLDGTVVADEARNAADKQHIVEGASNKQVDVAEGGENIVQKRKRGRPRKDSKKQVVVKQAGGHGSYQLTGLLQEGNFGKDAQLAASKVKTDTADGSMQMANTEQAGVVEKADCEPSAVGTGTEALNGDALAEPHEDRGSQLERSASNTEKETAKREGGILSGEEERQRIAEGSELPSASAGVTSSEVFAPFCACKSIQRQAVVRTVVQNGDPNQGLRYWSCSNHKPFTKKQRLSYENAEESCKYFRWLDAPRVTAKELKEARKERYRQVELQRLL